jgi:hypothetical protein
MAAEGVENDGGVEEIRGEGFLSEKAVQLVRDCKRGIQIGRYTLTLYGVEQEQDMYTIAITSLDKRLFAIIDGGTGMIISADSDKWALSAGQIYFIKNLLENGRCH